MPTSSDVSPHVQTFVCGFCFDDARETVVLIEKQQPAWQAGRLNGVGGKVEPGELPAAAMTREFNEEAGVRLSARGTGPSAWTPFCRLSWRGGDGEDDAPGQVLFFHSISSMAVQEARTMEAEVIRRVPVADVLTPGRVRDRCLPNLRWLIPLALDPDDTVARAQIGGELGLAP